MFGIPGAENVQTESREILAESIRIDTVVVFPDPFDFTMLGERIFPFLGRYNVFEYKAARDPLLVVGHFYQYSLVELGLMMVRYLSQERTDRRGRQWLSQRALRAQWQRLTAQGAYHSACTVILSATDPQRLRQEVQLEPVTDYPHLRGALYRRLIAVDGFVGSIATYLVVLNHLPVRPINAPLLLLAKGTKQTEFCRWLLEDAGGLTLEEKYLYQLYLIEYNLIDDKEVKQEMRYNLFGRPPNRDWIVEMLQERPEPERLQLFQIILQRLSEVTSPEETIQMLLNTASIEEAVQRLLNMISPEEIIQRLLDTTSPEETVQRLLNTTSPEETAQRLLTADSPIEAARKLLKTKEQRREFVKLMEQEDNGTSKGQDNSR